VKPSPCCNHTRAESNQAFSRANSSSDLASGFDGRFTLLLLDDDVLLVLFVLLLLPLPLPLCG